MKINKFFKSISNFIKKLMKGNMPVHISPEITKGKEVDEMIANYYWNWDEYKF